MDFFLWGHLIVLSLPGQSKDLMARLQAAVTVVDGSMLWHVRTCCMAQCHLPWNGWRLLWTSDLTVRSLWLDHLTSCGHLSVVCI